MYNYELSFVITKEEFGESALGENLPTKIKIIKKFEIAPGENDYLKESNDVNARFPSSNIYLAKIEDVLINNKQTNYVVVSPYMSGQDLLSQNKIVIALAYVIDDSIVNDISIDMHKCKYISICHAERIDNDFEKFNRKELYEYMNSVAENVRSKALDEQNSLVLGKIEKVFEYIKGKYPIVVRYTPDTCYLTFRQITALLNSLRALDNNNMWDAYIGMIDFVYDYGNTDRPVMLSLEQDILETQLNRIADKIKNIK